MMRVPAYCAVPLDSRPWCLGRSNRGLLTKKLLATERSTKACEKRLRILTKPLMITALSAKDRKVAEERLKILSALMRQCEGYLRDYMAGGQNVAKFHNIMRWVHEDTEETLKELLKIHGLPPVFMEPVRKEEQARRADRTKCLRFV